jgi:hypothetical protein
VRRYWRRRRQRLNPWTRFLWAVALGLAVTICVQALLHA